MSKHFWCRSSAALVNIFIMYLPTRLVYLFTVVVCLLGVREVKSRRCANVYKINLCIFLQLRMCITS